MRISDWSSDVCSSDLRRAGAGVPVTVGSLTASAPRAELGLEGRDLLDAEAANTAALSDAQPLHQLAGPDLAPAGPRLGSGQRRLGKERARCVWISGGHVSLQHKVTAIQKSERT